MKFMLGTLRGRLYLALIAVSVLTVGFGAWIRYSVEKENDQVDIVLNYQQMLELSRQSEEDIQWWLTELSKAGATAMSIEEDLLIQYLTDHFIPYYLTGEIFKDPRISEDFSDDLVAALAGRDDYDLVVLTEAAQDTERLSRGLGRYEGIDLSVVMNEDGAGAAFIIDGSSDELLYEMSGDFIDADGMERYFNRNIIGNKFLQLPVGFDDAKVSVADRAGLKVMLRPANHSDFAGEMVANYIEEIQRYDDVMPILLSYGKEELGFRSDDTDYVEDVGVLLDEYGFTVALTESNIQRQYGEKDGLPQLVAGHDNDDFVRLFTLWPYIQERYIYPGYSHGEEIGNAMYRAITERNIRVILFNPFMWNEFDYVTSIEDYNSVFDTLSDRLAVHGYRIGDFTVLDDMTLPTVVRVLLYMEILLFGVVLLNEGVFRMNRIVNAILVILAVLGAVGLDYVVPNLSVKLFAFLASVVFASLAGVVYYLAFLGNRDRRGSFASGILALLVSGATALLGGLYIGSVMAYTSYYLEIDLFTGVKLSLLAPIAVIILFMAIQYIKEKALSAENNVFIEARDESLLLLRQPIQVQHLALLVVAAAFGYIYLARSGHESGVDPMSFEIVMRNWLENVLPARPRNKEFLIAFPMIVFGMALKPYIRKWSTEFRYMTNLIIMGFGAIGFTSVTNTFSHIRTPLMMSVVRTLISMGFGVMVGLMFYVGFLVLRWLILKLVHLVRQELETVE